MFKLTRVMPLIASFFFSITLFSAFTHGVNADPTEPFGHRDSSPQVTTEKKFIVESIIHGNGIHTVVINGKVMQPNDTIGKYRLIAVNDQSVILRSETQGLKLPIFRENVVMVSVEK